MPYTAPHGLLTIIGDAFNQQEEWNVTLRLIGTAPPSTAELESVDAALETYFGSDITRLPVGRRYLGLKWAPQTTAGRYPEGSDAIEWFRETPYAGTGGLGYPQIALVLSLRTARSRGYASNGRMYFPCSAPIDQDTGVISGPNADTAAANGAALIAAIAGSGVGTPAVMSTVGAGRTEVVTGVRVGRVMDTQRRRRNQLPEGYTAVVPLP